jgi:transposase
MNATTYGLDVAKRVFQMYWVDAETGEIVNRKFGRDDLVQYLSRRPVGTIALEACGSAHWWARKFTSLGHKVVLLHAKFIRPFVQTNKTDAADARAIWTAVQQPGMRTVAAKSAEQQAMLGQHRIRALLVKFRTMQVNQLRGLLYEFGASFRAGRTAGLAEIRSHMVEIEEAVPGSLMCCLKDQLGRIDELHLKLGFDAKRLISKEVPTRGDGCPPRLTPQGAAWCRRRSGGPSHAVQRSSKRSSLRALFW